MAHPGPQGRQSFETEAFITGPLMSSGKAAGSATQQDAESGMLVPQPIVLDDQGGNQMQVTQDGKIGTLRRETHGHEPIVLVPNPLATFLRESGKGYYMEDDKAGPLRVGGGDTDAKGAVVFQANQSASGNMSVGPIAPALDVGKAGGMAVMQPVPLDLRNAGRNPDKKDEQNRQGTGVGNPGDPSPTLSSAFVPGVVTPAPKLDKAREISPTLTAKMQGSSGWAPQNEDAHLIPMVFQQNSRDEVRLMGGDGQVVGALMSEPGMKQQNYVATPISIQDATGKDKGQNGAGINESGVAYTVDTTGTQGVAAQVHDMRGRGEGTIVPPLLTDHPGRPSDYCPVVSFTPGQLARDQGGPAPSEDSFGTLRADAGDQHPHVAVAMQVRRLTPRECERLMGMEDDWTLVPHNGSLAKDGPRYKALGNSWITKEARWLGERIDMVEEILDQHPELKGKP